MALWKLGFEVGVAFGLNARLRRLLAVAHVDVLDLLPAANDLGKRRKAHAVEALVVHKIDEELRGARVRAGRRKRERLLEIRALDRIVLQLG